jgi:hypothetical protein
MTSLTWCWWGQSRRSGFRFLDAKVQASTDPHSPFLCSGWTARGFPSCLGIRRVGYQTDGWAKNPKSTEPGISLLP